MATGIARPAVRRIVSTWTVLGRRLTWASDPGVTARLRFRFVSVVAMTVIAAHMSPTAFAQLSDVKGSNDHPMVSRYAGSIIIGYAFRKFDEFVIPLGPIQRLEVGKTTFEPLKSQRVEGRATRILYVGPPDRSPLEIVRNYEMELKKNGFEGLYACAAAQCGEKDGWLATFYFYPVGRQLSQTPAPNTGSHAGQVSEYAFASPVNQRYLAMKRSRSEGDVYVSVYVATNRATHHKETQDHPIILLDVVDAIPIESGMVTIDAAAMAKDIATTGHVALYGITLTNNPAIGHVDMLNRHLFNTTHA